MTDSTNLKRYASSNRNIDTTHAYGFSLYSYIKLLSGAPLYDCEQDKCRSVVFKTNLLPGGCVIRHIIIDSHKLDISTAQEKLRIYILEFTDSFLQNRS